MAMLWGLALDPKKIANATKMLKWRDQRGAAAFEKKVVGQGTTTDTAKVAARGDIARPGADSNFTVAAPIPLMCCVRPVLSPWSGNK
jgi:hypothetical protein